MLSGLSKSEIAREYPADVNRGRYHGRANAPDTLPLSLHDDGSCKTQGQAPQEEAGSKRLRVAAYALP